MNFLGDATSLESFLKAYKTKETKGFFLTRKAVVDETFISKSSNLCKSIVRIDASQLYPYSMCQPIPAGLYTR